MPSAQAVVTLTAKPCLPHVWRSTPPCIRDMLRWGKRETKACGHCCAWMKHATFSELLLRSDVFSANLRYAYIRYKRRYHKVLVNSISCHLYRKEQESLRGLTKWCRTKLAHRTRTKKGKEKSNECKKCYNYLADTAGVNEGKTLHSQNSIQH